MTLRVLDQVTLSNACYSLRYSPHVPNQFAIVSCENYGIRGQGHVQIISNDSEKKFHWPDAQYDVVFAESNPSLVISASADGSILVWALDSNAITPVLCLREHQAEVWSVHWSESRSTDALLSTSADGTIRLWDFNR
jgi:WD40 repeat protein